MKRSALCLVDTEDQAATMQPEKIILLPPAHESLPSFHVQGELLPSFLDHLANSVIKFSEPPEPQGNLETGATLWSG